MDVSPLPSSVKASAVPFEKLAGNPNVSESDKVKEAARQFEAILLRQILGEARKTVITSSEEHESNEKGIYDDMINNQMADSISHSGAFGLAKSLEGQLVRQVLPQGGAQLQPMPAATPPAKSKAHKS
jgi:peptidoglycan hydrolase FlgJ